MKKKIESGKVKNERITRRKIKTKDGREFNQKTVRDTKTGKIKEHSSDLKNEKIQITNENANLLCAKFLDLNLQENRNQSGLLNRILLQLVEINYYISYLEPKAKRDSKEIIKHFDKLGITLKDK